MSLVANIRQMHTKPTLKMQKYLRNRDKKFLVTSRNKQTSGIYLRMDFVPERILVEF